MEGKGRGEGSRGVMRHHSFVWRTGLISTGGPRPGEWHEKTYSGAVGGGDLGHRNFCFFFGVRGGKGGGLFR